jgi:hypothetical protein
MRMTVLGGSATGPAKALYLAGVNVLSERAAMNGYGVRLASISMTEAPPGGISSLTFDLVDPNKVHAMARGVPVFYDDLANGRPLFRGWIQSWTVEPFGLGRVWHVRCIGVEVLLDWMKIRSLTIPAQTNTAAAIQSAYAAAEGVGQGLRANASSLAGGFSSSQAFPLSPMANVISISKIQKDVVITGGSLRSAIEAIAAASRLDTSAGFEMWAPSDATLGPATVDFYFGLRIQSKDQIPSDFATLTVTDTQAGPVRAHGLEHGADASAIPAGVIVIGGNAAGSGMVPTGDGLPGPVEIINDATILTAAAKYAAAQSFLTERTSLPERGSFRLVDWTPTGEIRPGSSLVLTDAETGATGTYRVAGITKTFTALRETWTVTYGAAKPSLARAVRRLTRAVLT